MHFYHHPIQNCAEVALVFVSVFAIPLFSQKQTEFPEYSVIPIKELKSQNGSPPDHNSSSAQVARGISYLVLCIYDLIKGLISIQLVGVIVWIIVEPPDTQVIYMYPLGKHPR